MMAAKYEHRTGNSLTLTYVLIAFPSRSNSVLSTSSNNLAAGIPPAAGAASDYEYASNRSIVDENLDRSMGVMDDRRLSESGYLMNECKMPGAKNTYVMSSAEFIRTLRSTRRSSPPIPESSCTPPPRWPAARRTSASTRRGTTRSSRCWRRPRPTAALPGTRARFRVGTRTARRASVRCPSADISTSINYNNSNRNLHHRHRVVASSVAASPACSRRRDFSPGRTTTSPLPGPTPPRCSWMSDSKNSHVTLSIALRNRVIQSLLSNKNPCIFRFATTYLW